MQLQGLADENKTHNTVNIENAADPLLGAVVRVIGRTIGLDALDKSIDQPARFIFFGKAHAESCNRLGHIKGLHVVVVIGAGQQTVVQFFPRGVEQPFPNRVALLGGPEGKNPQGGIGQTVFLAFFRENLGRYVAGGQIDQVEFLQLRFAGQAVVFAYGQSGVSGLIQAGVFAFNRRYGTILVDCAKILPQHCAGHVQALISKILHAKRKTAS